MSRPVPDGMAAVIATILLVLLGMLDQALGEDLREGRRIGLGREEGKRDGIEFRDGVIAFLVGAGEGVAVALLGDDMEQDRPILRPVA